MAINYYIKKGQDLVALYEWLDKHQPKDDSDCHERWKFTEDDLLANDNGFYMTRSIIAFRDEKDYVHFVMSWP